MSWRNSSIAILRRSNPDRPMAENDFDIRYVANLARITLSPEEEPKLGTQLGDILG